MTNSKPKVLIIGAENFGLGGRSVIAYNLIKEMTKEFSVSFLSLSQKKKQTKKQFELLNNPDVHLISLNLIQSQCAIVRNYRLAQSLREILEKENFDIIHIHADDAWEAYKFVAAARKAKVGKIIVHAHASNEQTKIGFAKRLIQKLFQKLLAKGNIIKISPSIAAKEYMFGSAIDDVTIVHNGIDLEKYVFDVTNRHELRERFDLSEGTILFGTIGRLVEVKNPVFIIDFISRASKEITDFKFLWIGTGPLKNQIRVSLEERELLDKVILMDSSIELYKIYSALDYFILPSFHEGLGIVNIEAQANGLGGLVSEGIPPLAVINRNFNRLPLSEGAEKWVQFFKSGKVDRIPFDAAIENVKKAKFDIRESQAVLREIYTKDILRK